MSSPNNQDLHNQGQTDAANGDYKPPHSVAETVGSGLPVIGGMFGSFDKFTEENKAYDEGWQHARDQKS